jgi:hypothetical protein
MEAYCESGWRQEAGARPPALLPSNDGTLNIFAKNSRMPSIYITSQTRAARETMMKFDRHHHMRLSFECEMSTAVNRSKLPPEWCIPPEWWKEKSIMD